jgi:hypothetical protein
MCAVDQGSSSHWNIKQAGHHSTNNQLRVLKQKHFQKQ